VKEFRRVVSVCAIQDIRVWRVSALRILKYIESAEYVLVCPDPQIPDFTAVTPSGWRIVGDSFFAGPHDFKYVESMVTGFNKLNVGHLFQQFLKMNALADPALKDEDWVLIWDADTVPLRKIRFINSRTGKVECYSGVEHHDPYFQTIQRLTGLQKKVGFSFIAQCFPTKVGWVREVVQAIAGSKDKHYVQVILENLPGLDPKSQEFSEYELMGTWYFEKHPQEVSWKTGKHWTRSGSRYLGTDFKSPWIGFFLFLLSFYYDFAAFEKWEERLSLGCLFTGAFKKIFRMLTWKN
jgi:hypothetical protein